MELVEVLAGWVIAGPVNLACNMMIATICCNTGVVNTAQ